MPTIYHIRRAVNHHIKCSSLIVAQVFTPGHVSSGKRCKCWSARSAAFPKEKSGRIANGFGTCFTICCFSPPHQGGEVPVTTLAYLGTYKCCSGSAAVFTFLLQHTDGKSLQPRSTENMNCDGADPPSLSILNFDPGFPFWPAPTGPCQCWRNICDANLCWQEAFREKSLHPRGFI